MSTAEHAFVGLADLLDLHSERYGWRTFAACRTVDPEVFYPGRGEDTAAAKAICAACPVRDVCLEVSLANGERFGIWGGLSERERRLERRRRRLPPLDNGDTP